MLTATIFTSSTDLEYLAIAGPKSAKSSANPDKVLSPVNNETKPPLLGTILASSISDLTAVDVLVTDSGSTPAIDLEYLAIAGPNLVKSSANPDKVLSPVNNETKPPLLGTSLAISANDLTAIEVFSTAVASTFWIDCEYWDNAGPNLVSSCAKSVKVLSPVNNETKPPLLGTILANLPKANNALEVFSTTSGLTLLIASAYLLK